MNNVVYVSMLRGINVSGQKKIKMAVLKTLYEDLGFGKVETYIQSGNVVFQSKKTSSVNLSKKIGSAIESQYGFTVPITIRTREELGKLIGANPFANRKNVDPSSLYVTFLESRPKEALIASINTVDSKSDEFIVLGNEIYLSCPGGYGKTKLSNNFFESKLKQSATTRNWKTVNVLYEMSLAG